MRAYDRLIRCDLYSSSRWCDLPSATHRLIFSGLVHLADDFGNLEGDPRPLWRWACAFEPLATPDAMNAILSVLCDSDLIRRYVVGSKAYFHIPRFKNTRKYFRRICPPSPWCDAGAYTGPRIRLTDQPMQDVRHGSDMGQTVSINTNQSLTIKPGSDMGQIGVSEGSDLTDGVGVGVGVGEKKKQLPPKATRLPVDWQLTQDLETWAVRFEQSRGRSISRDQVAMLAQTFTDYWQAKSGKDATKTNWPATWRNWVRNTTERTWANLTTETVDRPGSRGI